MRRLTRGDLMRLAALGGTAIATGGMLNACAGSRGSSSPADSSDSSQTRAKRQKAAQVLRPAQA